MRLDSSGNLGLGVTPSSWTTGFKALQISSISSLYQDTVSNTILGNNSVNIANANQYLTTAAASLYLQSAGAHKWYNAPSGTAGNTISFTQAMTLDASGNLLLGTTSAYGKLSVVGTNFNFALRDDISNYCDLASRGASTTYGGFVFKAIRDSDGSEAERARIDSSGNLLVGTTTAVEKLTVAGNISISTSGNPYLQIKTSGAGNNPYIRLQADTATWDIQGTFSNAGDELYLIYGGSNRGYFNSSTGAYTAVSDLRLKKNITDISFGLSSVMALRPVEYNMISEKDDAQKHLGFIAQETETVVPSSVSKMTDGIFGMDKTEIVPVLVKAIQELSAELNELKGKIA
jgi:hypothetical protein